MINIGTDEVVQRYVKALHSLGLEQNKSSKIKEDLSTITELIEKNKEFKKIIFSPLVNPKKHQELLKLISKKLKIDQITENFLFLLAFNKRLILIEKIIQFYDEITRLEISTLDRPHKEYVFLFGLLILILTIFSQYNKTKKKI